MPGRCAALRSRDAGCSSRRGSKTQPVRQYGPRSACQQAVYSLAQNCGISMPVPERLSASAGRLSGDASTAAVPRDAGVAPSSRTEAGSGLASGGSRNVFSRAGDCWRPARGHRRAAWRRPPEASRRDQSFRVGGSTQWPAARAEHALLTFVPRRRVRGQGRVQRPTGRPTCRAARSMQPLGSRTSRSRRAWCTRCATRCTCASPWASVSWSRWRSRPACSRTGQGRMQRLLRLESDAARASSLPGNADRAAQATGCWRQALADFGAIAARCAGTEPGRRACQLPTSPPNLALQPLETVPVSPQVRTALDEQGEPRRGRDCAHACGGCGRSRAASGPRR